MIVFKTVLKIIKKLKGMLILYTAILLSITLLNQTGDNKVANFEESKSDILIVNKDTKNLVTDNFVNYLKKHTNVRKIKKEKIDDAIFYRDINYAIYIPNNFGNDILNGIKPKITYKASGDYYSSYTEMLIKKYIKIASIYKDYYNDKELINKINNNLDKEIKVKFKSALNTKTVSSVTKYFNFLNYAFLAGCVYCISMVLSVLKEKNVYKRTIISSYDYKKYSRIVLLSNFVAMLFMYLLYMILSIILFKDFMFTENGIYFMINSFIFMICSLTIGFLIGTITQNKNVVGGIVNVVALGTSFLCGCFVPTNYMPDYVLNIAKVFPTYYFVSNNEIIRTTETFTFEALKPIINNAIIVLLFAVLFVIITNIINKKKSKIG